MTKHIHDSLKNMRRSPYQTVAALLVLTQTFFIGYIFVLLMISSELILRYFESQPQITAFFSADTEDQKVLEAKAQLEQKSYIKSVTVITKTDALELYQQENADDPLLMQLVTADILPASIEVSTHDIQSLPTLEQDLKQLPGIDEVVFEKSIADTLSLWTESLRKVGVGLLTILSFTSTLLVIVITSMKISAKRYAIKTMQLLGASRWYIKAPFFFEGVFYGLFGAFFGWVGVFTLLMYLTPWLLQFMGDIPLLPIPTQYMFALLAGGTGFGVLIGSLASLFSAQRFLK